MKACGCPGHALEHYFKCKPRRLTLFEAMAQMPGTVLVSPTPVLPRALHAVCINARGLDHVLTEGWTYEVERLPLGALRVWIDDDVFFTPSHAIVCCGDRFEVLELQACVPVDPAWVARARDLVEGVELGDLNAPLPPDGDDLQP